MADVYTCIRNTKTMYVFVSQQLQDRWSLFETGFAVFNAGSNRDIAIDVNTALEANLLLH